MDKILKIQGENDKNKHLWIRKSIFPGSRENANANLHTSYNDNKENVKISYACITIYNWALGLGDYTAIC